MRSIRMSKEAMGFAILTTLLSLAFVVSIVYAASSSGSWKGVNYTVSVWNLVYRSDYQALYSSHSAFLNNLVGGVTACITYTLEGPDSSHIATNTLYPSGPDFYDSRQMYVDVSDLAPNTYSMEAETRVQLFEGNDSYQDTANITGSFTKE